MGEAFLKGPASGFEAGLVLTQASNEADIWIFGHGLHLFEGFFLAENTQPRFCEELKELDDKVTSND